MTLAQLITLMQTWLDDPQGGYFTDAICTTFLNNAQRQVQRKLIQSGEMWYTQTVQTSTVADSQSYTLPEDFLRLHKLTLIVSGTYPNQNPMRLKYVTPVESDAFPTGTGMPRAYYLNKNSLFLLQVPNAVYTLEMLYSYLVEDMSSAADEPDVPSQYHEMIAIWATLDGFLKDQRDPNPVFAKKMEEYNLALTQDAQNRTVDSPRHVVETQDYGGFGVGF